MTTFTVPDLDRLLNDPAQAPSCDLTRRPAGETGWQDCENEAAWIFRVHLPCGHRAERRTILVCQDCCDDLLGDVPADREPRLLLCSIPSCPYAAEILAVEPLR
jgi:hypothetical protein